MSYELQVAAEAKSLAQAVSEKIALIEDHLGDEFKAFAAKRKAELEAAAKAAQNPAPAPAVFDVNALTDEQLLALAKRVDTLYAARVKSEEAAQKTDTPTS